MYYYCITNDVTMKNGTKKQGLHKPPLTFRPSGVTESQLRDLVEAWEENQSRVITRCIDRIWCSEIGSENPGKPSGTGEPESTKIN